MVLSASYSNRSNPPLVNLREDELAAHALAFARRIHRAVHIALDHRLVTGRTTSVAFVDLGHRWCLVSVLLHVRPAGRISTFCGLAGPTTGSDQAPSTEAVCLVVDNFGDSVSNPHAYWLCQDCLKRMQIVLARLFVEYFWSALPLFLRTGAQGEFTAQAAQVFCSQVFALVFMA